MASLPPLSEASAALSKVSKATRGVGRQCYRTLAGKRRLLSVLMVIALAVVPLGMTARADDRSDAVDQQNEAQKRQTELASSLEGVSAELGQAYLDLQSAETALTTAEDDLTTAESTLSEKEREQQTASDRLDVAEADLTTVTEEADASQADASESNVSVADLVVSTYQGDSSVSSWSYVLSSSDTVDDLNQRASTMEIAASIQETVLASAEAERAQDANRKARQDAATDRVSTLKDEADTAETEARTARDEAVTKRDEVATLKSDKETAASNLETQKEGLEQQQTQARTPLPSALRRSTPPTGPLTRAGRTRGCRPTRSQRTRWAMAISDIPFRGNCLSPLPSVIAFTPSPVPVPGIRAPISPQPRARPSTLRSRALPRTGTPNRAVSESTSMRAI